MIDNNDYLQTGTPLLSTNERIFGNSDHINNNNIHPSFVYESDVQNNNYPDTGHLSTSEPITCHNSYDYGNENILCLSNGAINFDEIPISALRSRSIELLSKRLNSIKVILSEDGVPRDWRGVLHSVGLNSEHIQSKADPMKEVLDLWRLKRKQQATIGQLQNILGNIDRWDVVDDTSDFFGE